MALALYRKYRPVILGDVVGQDHVSGPLHAALAAGRTGNAYLFSGPSGCGKSLIARILARSLNCVQGSTPDPCGACSSCLALNPGGPGTLDVIDLDASLHGGVEDICGLLDLAVLPPAESRFRVLIIDQARMLTGLASSALLGTVDEPADRTVFIFTTDKPDHLPSTLRSRTLHYPLRLLAPSALTVLLERVCQLEGAALQPGVLPLVVQASGGSARQALTILEQLLAGAGPQGVSNHDAVMLFGDSDPMLLDEMIDALAIGDAGSMFGAIDQALRVNDDARMLATNLLQRLRDLVILSSVPDAATNALIDVSPGQLQKMADQAAMLGPARAISTTEAIAAALAGMHGDIAHRLVLEICCARALLPSEAEPSQGIAQSDPQIPASSTDLLNSPGRAGPQPRSELTASIGVRDVRQVWPQVLAAVQMRRRSVGVLLRYADLVSLDDGVLRISVQSPAAARRLMEPANAAVVTTALSLVVGQDLPILAEVIRPAT